MGSQPFGQYTPAVDTNTGGRFTLQHILEGLAQANPQAAASVNARKAAQAEAQNRQSAAAVLRERLLGEQQERVETMRHNRAMEGAAYARAGMNPDGTPIVGDGATTTSPTSSTSRSANATAAAGQLTPEQQLKGINENALTPAELVNMPIDVTRGGVTTSMPMQQFDTKGLPQFPSAGGGAPLIPTGAQAVQDTAAAGKYSSNFAEAQGTADGKMSAQQSALREWLGTPEGEAARAADPDTYNDYNIQAMGLKPPAEGKQPSKDDRAISIYSKSPADRTPEETAYLKGFEKFTDVTKTQPGLLRIEALGLTRGVPMIDTKDGNKLKEMNWNEINEGNTKEPGRYAPAQQGVPAMAKNAIFRSMHYTIDQARKSIQALSELDTPTRAALSDQLKMTDPHEGISSFLRGEVGTHLTPQQKDAVQSLALLSEDAMTLRSVAGMGQGSDDLRTAIQAVLPSGKSPSKAYALQQLDKYEGLVTRLESGIPGVGNQGGGGINLTAPVPAGADPFTQFGGRAHQ